MANGGTAQKFSIAGRSFSPVGDIDVSIMIGGKENTVEMNGDSTARLIQKPVAWGLDGVTVVCDNLLKDQEYLQDVSNSGQFVAMSVTLSDGTVYKGQGTITGSITQSSDKVSASFKLEGPGKLTQ